MLTKNNYPRPQVDLDQRCAKCSSLNVNSDQSCRSIYVERKEGDWKTVGGVDIWEYRQVTKSKLVWFDYWVCLDCGWFVTQPVNPSDPIIGSVGYVEFQVDRD